MGMLALVGNPSKCQQTTKADSSYYFPDHPPEPIEKSPMGVSLKKGSFRDIHLQSEDGKAALNNDVRGVNGTTGGLTSLSH